MPLIAKTGRRALSVRALTWTLYAVLTVGAVTMVYPLVYMVAGSTKSGVDAADAALIPRFMADDTALFRKTAESYFNESILLLQATWDPAATSFRLLAPPPPEPAGLLQAWTNFLGAAALPFYFYELGYVYTPVSRGTQALDLRLFKQEMIRRFAGDLAELNRALESDFPDWNTFYVLPENYLLRINRPRQAPLYAAFREFKTRQPLAARYYFSPEGYFKAAYAMPQVGRDIHAYNRLHHTTHADWSRVRLPQRQPPAAAAAGTEPADWEYFVRHLLNLFWIRADPQATPLFREFLAAKYGDLDALNRAWNGAFTNYAAVPLPCDTMDAAPGMAWADWETFLTGWQDPATGRNYLLPADLIVLDGLDYRFRDFLRQRWGRLDELNRDWGSRYQDWAEIRPPQAAWFYDQFLPARRAWRWEFVRRNYIAVLDYVLLHGRALANTAVYCGLAILLALIVNPLAAYALSRYKPPSAYKVLLFMMLTMAFPPMVTQIPVFLMLRKLDLLNTFWALVLPGMANGYSIFLLKGFFDSLPQDLYDSAALDGAGEFRVFWTITMSLSQPILAVIALHAFTLAYSNFMMALLICQDQRMWTLMPWLYQLQQRSGPGVIMASLLLAAVPTFLVFVVCQKVIIRGIVVPVEK